MRSSLNPALEPGRARAPGAPLTALPNARAARAPRLPFAPTLPPQSRNAEWNGGRADGGGVDASRASATDPQRAGSRPNAPLVGPAHSASIRNLRAGPTDTDDGNKSDKSLEAIKTAHRSPIPLVPGSLR
jgi:hypothetical protein